LNKLHHLPHKISPR